jgi:hypothetical protein
VQLLQTANQELSDTAHKLSLTLPRA